MRDYREVRTALREMHEPAEVAAIIEHFLSQLTPAEAGLLPAQLRGGKLAGAGMEALAEVALDLKREELRHRSESPEMRTLEAVACVLAAAASRLAEISGPQTLRRMIAPTERGIAERRIARRPDA
jgi:hypothetical protein